MGAGRALVLLAMGRQVQGWLEEGPPCPKGKPSGESEFWGKGPRAHRRWPGLGATCQHVSPQGQAICSSWEPLLAGWRRVFSHGEYLAWAVAGWLSGFERRPVHQKVAGSVHGQGTCPGCEFNFRLGRLQEATDCCFSHLIFLSPPPL